MPSLFKRSNGVFYIAYNVEGKRRWKSTGKREKHLAINALLKFEKLISQPTKRLVLSQFIADFLSSATTNYSPGTIGLYRTALRNFQSIVGDFWLSSVTPKHIDIFKTKRLESLSPITLNIELRTLRAIFNQATRLKFLDDNPFAGLKGARVVPREAAHMSTPEIQRLLSVIADEEFKSLVVFAIFTMMRLGELTHLEWGDVDLDRRLIHVRHKEGFRVKGGRERTVPMNDWLYHFLIRKVRSSSFVFSGPDGMELKGPSVSHRFKRYVRMAGINQEIHFHSLRHTGVSLLINKGVPSSHVQRLAGHSSMLTTAVYTHLEEETMRRAVAEFPALG
jgi:integrase